MNEKLYKFALEHFKKFPEYNYLGVDACGCMNLFKHKPKLNTIYGKQEFTVNFVWDMTFWGYVRQCISKPYVEMLTIDFCDGHDNPRRIYNSEDANLITRKWFKKHKML